MLILGIDTTTSRCSIVIARNHDILAILDEETPQRHAQILVPRIMEALKQAKLDLRDLTLLTATTGPGSFTGIRTGLATMQGFQLALNLPLLGINAFDLYAAQVPSTLAPDHPILVVLENQKSLCYAGILNRNLEFIKAPVALTQDALGSYINTPRIIFTGSVAHALKNQTPMNIHTHFSPPLIPRASMLCALAFQRASQRRENSQSASYSCKPFYIAPPSTTVNPSWRP